MGRARALIALLHPAPSLATVVVALGVTALVHGGLPPVEVLALLGASLALQQLATSVHNDWCDRDIDAIAKPHRAIPGGVISPTAALWLAAALAAGSVALAAPLGWDEVALVTLWLMAAAAYNAGVKRTRWSWVPFSIAFPLIGLYGAAALDRWPSWLPLACVLAQPAIIAIHLADSLPDLDSDAAAGSRGLAWHLGPERASRAMRIGFAVSGLALAALAIAVPLMMR